MRGKGPLPKRQRPGVQLHETISNEPVAPVRVIMNGNRLDIQTSVDLDGLKKLQLMLAKYQGILEMMQPEDDEAAN